MIIIFIIIIIIIKSKTENAETFVIPNVNAQWGQSK